MQLIGVLVIIIGFILKLDAIAVIIFAGLVTGFASNMDLIEILSTLGHSFVNTRYMSLFLITLPVIGILERNGLRNTSMKLIQKLKGAKADFILFLYMVIRIFSSILGIRMSGHVQFIRPIVYPMVESAALIKDPNLTKKQKDALKAVACTIDNYGNFFGQNGFVANAGVLLIIGTLSELGIKLQNFQISQMSLIIAFTAIILVFIINKIAIKKILEHS
ncbi:MAG: 5-oxoproline transporter, DUF969 family subunit [Brevinema sp.]